MKISLRHRPSYATAFIELASGESVYCEAGSLVMMSAGVDVSARAKGGLLESALRSFFAQNTFFLSRYRASRSGCWVAVAPRMAGDIAVIEVRPSEPLLTDQAAFLAHSEGVSMVTRLAAAQTFALRKGAVAVRFEGSGKLIIGSYGALERMDLAPEETLVVDTGHIAAWSAGMDLQIGPLRGVVSSQLTKEGLVGQFRGPGTVYVQTRAEADPGSWFRPSKGQNVRRKKR